MERWRSLVAFISTALAVCPASLAAGAPPDAACKFPSDCMRHVFFGISPGSGTCVSKRAWRDRYVRGTLAERSSMFAERRKTMGRRVFDAYDITEEQEVACARIQEEFFEERRQAMARPLFEESRSLRRATRERMTQRVDLLKSATRGDPGAKEEWERIGPLHDDPLLNMYRDRLDQIKRAHPLEWGDLAKRIEAVLPPDQAKEGGLRLAAQFPHGFSKFPKTPAEAPEQDGAAGAGSEGGSKGAAPDRWEAYVVQFKARYSLASGQETAVASILRETRERVSQLTQTMRDAVARDEAARNDESARGRREVFDLFTDEMFEDFKTRLIALLTTSQLEAAKVP